MWSQQPGEFIPGCGADAVVPSCSGNAVRIRQMGFGLDLDLQIGRVWIKMI